MGDRVLYSLIGSVVGLTIPFDWLLWRAFSARKDWWMSWLKTEFTRHGSTYILMAVLAVAVFAALGYFLGQQRDEMTEESEQARSNNAELSALANTDGLTGLLNARAVHEQLEFEMENSYRTPLTILLLDIDHFKKINDTYGHPFGDDVLAGVARLVRGNVRRSDPVGRLSGEEFVVILNGAPPERAQTIADNLRKVVQQHVFSYEGKTVPVTISIGIASTLNLQVRSKDALLKSADEALYKAKRSGRNRVVVFA